MDPGQIKTIVEVGELVLKLALAAGAYFTISADPLLRRSGLGWMFLAVALSISLAIARYKTAKRAHSESLASRRETILWLAFGFVSWLVLRLVLAAFDANQGVHPKIVYTLIDVLIVFLYATTFGLVAYSCSLQIATLRYLQK